MKRYWTRITLGALAIFAVGMIVVTAGREGVDHVKHLATQQLLNLTPGVAPFQVDSRRLGTLTQVQMDPERSEGFPFINLTVQLDPNLATAGLDDCLLLAGDSDAFGSGQGLNCAAPGTSADSLMEMGAVTFQPGGQRVSMFVPTSQLGENLWFKNASQRTRPQPKPSGSFDLEANAAGAFMLIKDDKGRPVFQLNADSQGAFIQIRDSNGQEVVRFRADSQGVVGRVHSD